MMPCALICEYYNDEISLLVVGMGEKKQGGKRERTAQTPQSVFFFPVSKTPTLAEARNVFATE
jgi:hypothetical protein